MEKKNCFQKILFVGILIILLLSSCNGLVSSSLDFDEGDVEFVSFSYDWEQSVFKDTTQLICQQSLVYSSYGKEITLAPLAYVKLWIKQDTVSSTSEMSIKPTSYDTISSSSSSGVSPIRYKLLKSFELNDAQVIMAEIVYEDFNLSSQETGQTLPHLEITDFTLEDINVVPGKSADDNYAISVTFNVPWSVINRGDRGTEKVGISYVKSSVGNTDDQLLSTSYDTGTEWVDASSFRLFVNKIENWKVAGTVSSKTYSPTLAFSLNPSDKPSLMAENLDFKHQVSLNQTKAEQISSDEAWNIQKKTAVQTIRFDNGSEDFTHAFSYPVYEASALVDGQEINFDLTSIFDYNIKTSQFGDRSKKIISAASIAFGDRTFDASTATLLVLRSGQGTEDGSDNQNTDGEDNLPIETPDDPSALKYGRIIDFQVSAVLDVDAYQMGGTITKKAVVVRFEEGYYFGVCKYNEDFPTQFYYTQSGYSGFNSVAQPKAGKPFRIARAVVYKDAIKWFAEDNSLIMGIDALSCGIFGWSNIVGGIYSAFINSYNHTYSSDRYSLTLTAPSGRTLLIKSKAL